MAITIAQMRAEIATQLANNTTGNITAPVMSTVVNDMLTCTGSLFDFTSYSATLTGTVQFGTGIVLNTTTGSVAITGGYSSTKAIVYAPGNVPAPAINGIYIAQTATGTCDAAACPINKIIISTDDINATPANVVGILHSHFFGGAAATGNRIALSAQAILNTPTGNHFNVDGKGSYAGMSCSATANSPDNGTGLVNGQAAGQIQAFNSIGRANAGGTNLYQVSAAEFNTEVKASSSTYEKIGVAIVDMFDSVVSGNIVDTALSFANQVGSVNWNIGIGFNRPDGQFPIKTTGTIMGVETGLGGTCAFGIDFNQLTFTNSALRTPGFRVDGSGNVTAATYTPNAKPSVTGSRGGNAALASLLTALATIGLITNNTTA